MFFVRKGLACQRQQFWNALAGQLWPGEGGCSLSACSGSWCTVWGHPNCQRLCQHLQRSVLLIPCANLLILLFPLAPLASISNLSYPLVSLPGMLFLFLYNPLPLCLLFVVLLPPTLPLIVLFMACSVCCVVKETLCISFLQLLGNPSERYIE